MKRSPVRHLLPANLLGKFLLILLPVAFIVMSVAIAVLGMVAWQTEIDALEQDMADAAQSFAGALSVPVWTYENSAQESIQESILLNPHIVAVDVLTDREQANGTAPLPDFQATSFTISHPIASPFDKDLQIGTVTLTYTRTKSSKKSWHKPLRHHYCWYCW